MCVQCLCMRIHIYIYTHTQSICICIYYATKNGWVMLKRPKWKLPTALKNVDQWLLCSSQGSPFHDGQGVTFIWGCGWSPKKHGCVWKCCVPLNPMVNDGFADHYPYWMAISLGILTQHFQTKPHGYTQPRERKSMLFHLFWLHRQGLAITLHLKTGQNAAPLFWTMFRY